MSINILYEDTNIVVCIKPAGVDSQESERANMISLLKESLDTKIFPVHRLDRETGGIMVFAKNANAAANLSAQITEGKMQKKYLAVLTGVPANNEDVLTDLIFRDKAKNKSYIVKRMRKGVKDAKLEYHMLSQKDGMSLVDVKLYTGRTHQIRVQFSSRKLPLFGDGKYGGGAGNLALYAKKLDFFNPASGEMMSFSSLPDTSEYPWSLFREVLP